MQTNYTSKALNIQHVLLYIFIHHFKSIMCTIAIKIRKYIIVIKNTKKQKCD